jgi:hypothetical protein
MKREKTPASALGEQLRTMAAAYAAHGQREKAEGLVQASYSADAHLHGSTTGIVDPIVEALLVAARAVVEAADRIAAAADRVTEAAADLASAGELVDHPPGVELPPPTIVPRRPRTTSSPVPRPREDAAPAISALHGLDAGQSRVLVALRQAGGMPGAPGIDRYRLALLTEYSAVGGRYVGILSRLRALGLIDPDALRLTTEGVNLTAHVPPMPSGAKLLELWLRKLPKAAADVLGELAAVYPRKLTPAAIAARLGRQVKGGSFVGAVSRLRRLQLAHGKRELVASHVLFDSEPGPSMLAPVNGAGS